jgi:hypothetical protein
MPQARLKTLFAWKALSQEVKVLFAYPKNHKRSIDNCFTNWLVV